MRFFFFGSMAHHPEDPCRVTSGKNYEVHGGSKEEHEKLVDLVENVSGEVQKDPPQTPGEFNMIVRDAVKKVGLDGA
jgi:hypothetical protein